jgi:hypothetical protein
LLFRRSPSDSERRVGTWYVGCGDGKPFFFTVGD